MGLGMSYPAGCRRGEAGGSSEEAGGTLASEALEAAALLGPLEVVMSAIAPVSTTAGTGPVPQEYVFLNHTLSGCLVA